MLKKTFILSFIAVLPFVSHAQRGAVDSSRLKAFLYARFIDGYVLLKTGDVEQAPLNYNTDDQSIYFLKDGKYMELSGLESVDTVYLQNKKFVPVKHDIYEVVTD